MSPNFPINSPAISATRNFKQELLAPDVLSGILSTLVRECLAWQKEGLIVSDAMKKEKQNYFDANNFIADFVSEYCEFGEDKNCKRKDILTALKQNYYREITGLRDKELTEMLQKEFKRLNYKVTYTRIGSGNVFRGVGLIDRQGDLTFESIKGTAEEVNNGVKDTPEEFNLQNHTETHPPADPFKCENVDDDDLPF